MKTKLRIKMIENKTEKNRSDSRNLRESEVWPRSVTFVFFPAGSVNPLDLKNPLDSRIQGIFNIRLVRWIFYPGDFGDFSVTEHSAGFVNPGDS